MHTEHSRCCLSSFETDRNTASTKRSSTTAFSSQWELLCRHCIVGRVLPMRRHLSLRQTPIRGELTTRSTGKGEYSDYQTGTLSNMTSSTVRLPFSPCIIGDLIGYPSSRLHAYHASFILFDYFMLHTSCSVHWVII